MVDLHISEIIFIKNVLEDELMRLELKRSRADSIYSFDLINKDRMDYIRYIINKLYVCLGDNYEYR